MNRESKIFVAGHRGLVGSALMREFQAEGYENLLTRSRAELDLTRQEAVEQFFHEQRPEVVILAAARVGGILANNTFPAEFISENLSIQTNVIDAAYRAGVGRLLFLGSSCIYPRQCPQPIKEEYLLTGPLEPTNEAYAIAKIAGIKMCQAYRKQYGFETLSVMPTNLYGPGDNFDLNSSHVLPALIRKFHEAKLQGRIRVEIWGTGKPRREFMHVSDLARACLFLLNLPQSDIEAVASDGILNVGVGEDLEIRELARLIGEIVGGPFELSFDTTKPDGTPRKLLDVSRMRSLGWSAQVGLRDGLKATYEDFSRHARAEALA
ncbi:MAG: GDP-L-fucose synthase [Pyrinomonadaceae bacterium]|nr:GDP-L-fucose synthase [Pyrinomonadaceae bacterium]